MYFIQQRCYVFVLNKFKESLPHALFLTTTSCVYIDLITKKKICKQHVLVHAYMYANDFIYWNNSRKYCSDDTVLIITDKVFIAWLKNMLNFKII